MRRRRPAPRLSRPKPAPDAEEELEHRVREALVDKSTPPPLDARLRERVERMLGRDET